MFSGRFVSTRRVFREVPLPEIFGMYLEIQKLVELYGSIDYLHTFRNKETQQEVYIIDQLSKNLRQTRNLTETELKEQDQCIILFSEEY